jgi:hypothetical protein
VRLRTVRCRRCKSQNQSQPKGWVPIFCGRNCRQRADEHNLALRPTLTPINMLVRDLDTVRIRNASVPKFWRSCATWGLTLRPHRRTNRSAHICASYNGSRKWSGAKCGRRRAKLISKGRLEPRGPPRGSLSMPQKNSTAAPTVALRSEKAIRRPRWLVTYRTCCGLRPDCW